MSERRAAMSQVNASPTTAVRRLTAVTDTEIAGLVGVLADCVEGGASVGFMHPVARETAEAFWRGVATAVDRGERMLFVAEDADGIVGTMQLLLDLPENQPHRAEVAKVLVHRRGRRQGLGEALMRAAEEAALSLGRTLLVLDTVTGSDAERLYTRLGWRQVGVIPGYALFPDGRPCDTTVFYRRLGTAVSPK